MALVNFVAPYHKITGTRQVEIDAPDVRALCLAIIHQYGEEMGFLLDENNELSRKIVLLVGGRNAYILQGADTPLDSETKVHIMTYLGWA